MSVKSTAFKVFFELSESLKKSFAEDEVGHFLIIYYIAQHSINAVLNLFLFACCVRLAVVSSAELFTLALC